MRKEYLTEKLLYIIATVADHNRNCFSWQLALAMRDDPRRFKYRRWLIRQLKNKKQKKKLQDALYTLKRRKFLEKKVFKNREGYILTSKGQLKLLRLTLKNVRKEKYSDGRYLMVFFDIPEKIRRARDLFRLSLQDLGFQQVQKSVWVTQYKVEKELQELIKDCAVQEYVKPLFVRELQMPNK
jgi:DNA-binding transcriptional regulator PaaX